MTSSSALDHFLDTDPLDVGCAEAMRILHVYVDLLITAGADTEHWYRGVTAHLRACGPCREDFDGLLAAASGDPDTPTR